MWRAMVEITFKNIRKYEDEMAKLKVKCKHCGHTKVIPKFLDKVICNWCGHAVYRDPKKEFEERLRSRL